MASPSHLQSPCSAAPMSIGTGSVLVVPATLVVAMTSLDSGVMDHVPDVALASLGMVNLPVSKPVYCTEIVKLPPPPVSAPEPLWFIVVSPSELRSHVAPAPPVSVSTVLTLTVSLTTLQVPIMHGQFVWGPPVPAGFLTVTVPVLLTCVRLSSLDERLLMRGWSNGLTIGAVLNRLVSQVPTRF